MNFEPLLARIDYRGSLECSLATLHGLQYAFLTSVPFENLDIHLGREVKLDFDHIWYKVVERRRGGWCYELNELFLQLLIELGFNVKRCAGRVILRGAGDSRDHQVSVVDLGARWLVDVGFGQFALAPLSIDSSRPQEVEGIHYLVQPERLSNGESGEPATDFRVSMEVDNQSTGCYVFSTMEIPRLAFQDRCKWLQTSAESSFVHKRMCSKHTQAGRLTLSGNQLLLNGARVAWVREEEYGQCLREKFGIVLTEPHWIVPLQKPVKG